MEITIIGANIWKQVKDRFRISHFRSLDICLCQSFENRRFT